MLTDTGLAVLLLVLSCLLCPLTARMPDPVELTTRSFVATLVAEEHDGKCEVAFQDIGVQTPSLAINRYTFAPDPTVYFAVLLTKCESNYYYLTRDDAQPTQFNTNVINNSNDKRLWKTTQCGLESQNAFGATLYWNNGDFAQVLTVKNNKLHLAQKQMKATTVQCFDSGFYVYIYPEGIPEPDLCASEILAEIRAAAIYTSRLGKRSTPNSLGRLLRLTIAVDGQQYVVARRCNRQRTYADELAIEPLILEHLTAGSLFYYTSYKAANRNGELSDFPDEVTFTLLHAVTRQFLTVDVDDLSLSLKVGGNLTGLIFQDESNFFESPLLDSRHFKLYGSGRAFCAVQYRSFCVRPERSGLLRLYPVDTKNSSPRPSFRDPTNVKFSAFNNASRQLANSVLLPTFGVFERRAVVALGSPEILYISEYTQSPGNAQSLRVLSYDSATNSIRLTTRSQALLSPYRIVRQQWTEPGSSSIFISLQVTSGQLSSPSSSGLFITRLTTSPVQISSPFVSVDVDSRLFSTKYCFSSQNIYDVQRVYFHRGCNEVSLSIAQNGTLVLQENDEQSTPICQTYALTMSTS